MHTAHVNGLRYKKKQLHGLTKQIVSSQVSRKDKLIAKMEKTIAMREKK